MNSVSDTLDLVTRLSPDPVVACGAAPGYGAVFNAGLLCHEGLYYLFARAVRDGYFPNPDPNGPRFLNYVSDILVFVSPDGLSYEFDHVLAAAGSFGVDCYEDARVQYVSSQDETHVIMTYTNLPDPASGIPHHIGAHRLIFSNGRFQVEDVPTRALGPAGVPNKDATVFNLDDGRVAMIHRIHPDMQIAVFDDLDHLFSAGPEYWDPYMLNLSSHVILARPASSLGIGAGAPPVLSPEGYLLFFHERRWNGTYTMNLALLDSATGELKKYLPWPLLEPQLDWEIHGDVDNVVFVQGAVASGNDVYLVYGAADRCIGAATTRISHLLTALDQFGAPSVPDSEHALESVQN